MRPELPHGRNCPVFPYSLALVDLMSYNNEPKTILVSVNFGFVLVAGLSQMYRQ